MIPCILGIALVASCSNSESEQSNQNTAVESGPAITVHQQEAAIDSAMQHLNANRSKEAIAITTTLVNRNPNSAEAQEVHALALIAEGWRHDNSGNPTLGRSMWEEALAAYIVSCNQSTAPGLLQLSTAQLAHMLGDIPTAQMYYKLSHENVPQDARASFFLGQIELLNSQWEPAKSWIVQSLARNPNEPYALLSLALIEAQLGNVAEAVEIANKGCAILPSEPNLRFIQARVMRLAGRPEQALEMLMALPKNIQDSELCQGEFQSCLTAIESGN